MGRGLIVAAGAALVLRSRARGQAAEATSRSTTHPYAFSQAPDWFGTDRIVHHAPPPEGGAYQVHLLEPRRQEADAA